MEVITGVLYHSVGASCAALCYTPQKKVAHWSWQTYWLAQAAVCWLLLPLVIAWLTIPHLSTVLKEAPTDAMWKTFVLGVAYGIGGTAFGMAIRYVGFSLTYAIAVGISCVLGTLIPPLVHGQLSTLFQQQGSGFVIAGIAIGALGIALCGIAGRFKEQDLEEKQAGQSTFSLAKGLPLCFLAGVLSAVYGFSLDQGQPIAEVAARHGSGHFQGNVIYIFSNAGAFVSTLIYCIYLHRKQGTFGEYAQLGNRKNNGRPAYRTGRLILNFTMAVITGLLWYSQFFFYGLGHVRMGTYQFTSWAIHMIMLVLFSTVAGLIMKEWMGCRNKTIVMLVTALIVLIGAVLVLTYGNYLGSI
jgi:L-rhamnose-H+ transport protein